MTVAQAEHLNTFRETLPTQDTLSRLAGLFKERETWTDMAAMKRHAVEDFNRPFWESEPDIAHIRAQMTNQLTHAELKLAEVEVEIIEVARMLVAEKAAVEAIAQ